MKVLRKQLPWGLAVLLAVSAVVLGAAPASAESSDDGVCAEEAVSDEATQLNICYRAFCHEESDCWNACPGALSVSCTRGVCYYQQPTGGGGGGGPVCPQQFCGSDFDCSCNGRPGVCGANNTCYY
ncbi:hypothetical protein SAMN05443572_1011174 [Myxococcus fulvus]|uniref:Lipoprotein n=1 Tax=Myxococcus fulvus TaxID=33 RepID=A0A511SUX6_MYXFU|nr:hypothetical protein [Myxococcus fulvus]GEN05282.1 hypothetical protein MFU01_03190 [Myxococcus fulvus]SET12501.1 hypothetical protein SAMN05443572_1011174 [Myxococcus fulvus]